MKTKLTPAEIICIEIQDNPEQSIQYYLDHLKSIDSSCNIDKDEFWLLLRKYVSDTSRVIDVVIGNDLVTLYPEEIILLTPCGFTVANNARSKIGLKKIDYPGNQKSQRPGRKNKYTFEY